MSSLTRRAGSEKEPEDLLVRLPGLVLVSLSSTSLGLREVAIGDLDKVWLQVAGTELVDEVVDKQVTKVLEEVNKGSGKVLLQVAGTDVESEKTVMSRFEFSSGQNWQRLPCCFTSTNVMTLENGSHQFLRPFLQINLIFESLSKQNQPALHNHVKAIGEMERHKR